MEVERPPFVPKSVEVYLSHLTKNVTFDVREYFRMLKVPHPPSPRRTLESLMKDDVDALLTEF